MLFRFTALTLILHLSLFAITREEGEPCPDGTPHHRMAFRHIESGGIGYKEGYTSFEAFLAPDPSRWSVTPFIDTRGHVFDDGRWAANAGLGLRTLWGNRVYGVSTYYDYRNTRHFHSNQIGLGLETLGELFDVRLNGYLPVGAKMSHPYDTTFNSFSGNYALISQKYKSAMKGADAEFGVHFGKSKFCDFYAAMGPYYYTGHSTPSTWGGKARISGTFKEILTLEISDSYDGIFHNKFQGKISFSIPLGPKSKIKSRGRTCTAANLLNARMLQPVDRQEIIVIDKVKTISPAINPSTGLPYFFVFVDNTSSSNGTYASPYHTLAQAQNNSSPDDIIYLFPGDGTTTGMNSGITLQDRQKLWGSSLSYLLPTTAGTVSIPAQSSSPPTITNPATGGHAIILAADNVISGIKISSAKGNAIYGTDPHSLDVSFCTIERTNVFAIQATFPGEASMTLTNNQFLNNANGVFLTLNGTSTLTCSDNTFSQQSSVSNGPIAIWANNNTLVTRIENNVFDHNITGTISFRLQDVAHANITVLNNTMTNNGSGAVGVTSGASLNILPIGTTEFCSLDLEGNTFSANIADSIYLSDEGAITALDLTISKNTLSHNGNLSLGGGAGLTLVTPVDTLTMVMTDNTITGILGNGIVIISSALTSTGHITISNNTITDIAGFSNGIAINQDFSTLNLDILNNTISYCKGTGILSYPPTGIDSLTLNISNNTISYCDNLASNAASGIDIEQYTHLIGSVTNNTLSDNNSLSLGVVIGAHPSLPTTTCLTLTGNSSNTNYLLSNSDTGVFNLSPCNVDALNVGTIQPSGAITHVQSCPDGTPCS